MIIYKVKSVEKGSIADVLCDICKKSCNVEIAQGLYEPEYMELEAYWGYGSNHDGEHWKAQVCEKCVEEKFSFIVFEKSGELFGTDRS